MQQSPHRPGITSRVIRPGQGTPPLDDSWQDATMEERIAAVWELTRLCYAWNREDTREPEFQRTVVHIRRPHASEREPRMNADPESDPRSSAGTISP